MSVARWAAVIAASAVVAASLLGCSLVPPTVVCGEVDPEICHRRADEVIGQARAEDPVRGIVRVTIVDDRGSYEAEFDDGTSVGMMAD